MKLDSLTPVHGSKKNRKRVGRGHGSGLGKSAGRGDKGADARHLVHGLQRDGRHGSARRKISGQFIASRAV